MALNIRASVKLGLGLNGVSSTAIRNEIALGDPGAVNTATNVNVRTAALEMPDDAGGAQDLYPSPRGYPRGREPWHNYSGVHQFTSPEFERFGPNARPRGYRVASLGPAAGVARSGLAPRFTIGAVAAAVRGREPQHFTTGDVASAVRGGNVGSSPARSAFKKYAEMFRGGALDGFVPKDGARWGIKSGSPEEWARLAVAVSQQESGLNPNAPGGGLNQFTAADLAHYGVKGAVNDPAAQMQALVNQWSSAIPQSGNVSAPGGGPGSYGGWQGAGAFFGSMRYGAGSGHGAVPDVAKYLGQGNPAAPYSPVTAAGGVPPAAFIMHHTGGGGDVGGVQSTLRQRGLGVEYVMDRDGNIFQTGGPGAANILPGYGPKGQGLDNRNVVGMEVIARDDKDVTPAQVAAAKAFMEKYYPKTPVFGHGEVNPGHKEADEGMTIVNAIRAQRAADAASAARAAAARPDDESVDNK
jgi:hypothetical protein